MRRWVKFGSLFSSETVLNFLWFSYVEITYNYSALSYFPGMLASSGNGQGQWQNWQKRKAKA